MNNLLKLFVAIGCAISVGSALSQTSVWEIPVRSNVVGPVATIVAPGVAWPAGTPLGGFAAQASVTVVGNFYAALASGNVATATTLICPADRTAFASADKEQLKSYLQEFRTQQRVGLIQYPSRSLLFVRLNSQSEVMLRVLEVLPPSGSTGSCITQVDPMAKLLRDLLAVSMPDVSPQDFPNPYPNGIPNR